jgi:hypothetical protein
MFDPLIHVSWTAGLVWLAGIATAAFLVSWTLSDLRPTKRVFYIPILALVTGILTAGYLLWSEAGSAFWTNQWAYGLLGAALAGGLLTVLLNRRPIPHGQPQAITARTLGWDGLVYGAAEGMLLSVLPVVVTWQMLSSNGWGSGWRSFAAGLLAIVASIVVIVVHHLGYPDFRGAKMSQAVLGCGILSIAYLLTASVIAPILAHAVLHVVVVRKGMELPPHEETHETTEIRDVMKAAA